MTISSVIATARTAHEILALEDKQVRRANSTLSTNPVSGERTATPIGVSFRNVSFRYPEASADAIHQISFAVEHGQQVALMGTSGAGKSTIADLICGVLVPYDGVILRTTLGQDSSGESDRISYVPQRPGLVSGTILANVALGLDAEFADRARALESLQFANLSDLISELPEGLDTPLGKMQEGLSGGQLQRLGLARALYSNPGLLVMDEATSALDADSENEIQMVLDRMRGKVTVVLIAHRLNTIQRADKVFLVDEGQVKDSGTFKELVSRNPSVERLVDLMRIDKD
jgi:ATP-binding cassette subfamily C protein